MFNKYLIVTERVPKINPTIAKRVKSYLISHRFPVSLQVSQYRENTKLVVKKAVRDISTSKILLVVGPDDFLNDVVNDLVPLESGVSEPMPIAYLPTDPRSDLANRYHLSTDWRVAISKIVKQLAPRSVPVGYFHANPQKWGRYFLNDTGIGYNTNLIKELWNPGSKRHLMKLFGIIAYLIYNLQSFSLIIHRKRQKPVKFKRVFLISVFLNAKHELTLTIVRRRNFFLIMLIAIMISMGKHPHLKTVKILQRSQFHIEIPNLEYGNTDDAEIGSHYYDLSFTTTTYPFYL